MKRPQQHSARAMGMPHGFTLLELLVAVAIIALVSTYVLVNYRATQNRVDVRLEAYRFAATVRQAQNYALGAYENNGAVPVGGWGVYIADSANYRLFADDGDHVFDAGDAVVEAKQLPDTVVFPATSQDHEFVFLPPNPTTYLDGVNQGSVTITLQQADDASNTHTVTMNAFGLVDVD